MYTLAQTFANYEIELLKVIAAKWDVDLGRGKDVRAAGEKLAAGILDSTKAEKAWAALDDQQRGAMQSLVQSGGKYLSTLFERMFGEIRPVGPGKLEREKPHLSPVSIAEALYYRGLIATGFEPGKQGAGAQVKPITYVPTDLMKLLPAKETGYKLEPEAPRSDPLVTNVPQPDNIKLADTQIVDDLTTLLAYLRIVDVEVGDDGVLPEQDRLQLKPYLLTTMSAARSALMIALARDLNLVTGSPLRPNGLDAKKWLELHRPDQVRQLIGAWQRTTRYNELHYTPGLKVEPGQSQNDPLLARQAILNYLESVPTHGWWNVDELISAVKEDEPDFQRPNGDYDSWYVREVSSGKYLKGVESWDQVDGAQLRFIITGVMNGLGLVDTASNGTTAKLTTYGRAGLEISEYPKPSPEDTAAKITIQADGEISVPRHFSRFERFQLARFTQWLDVTSPTDPFLYRVCMEGLAIAEIQKIDAEKITSFLKRASDGLVPEAVQRLIDTWGGGGSGSPATISRPVLLQMPGSDVLDAMMKLPDVRRYLGARVGDTAVIVQSDKWQALIEALGTAGVTVDVERWD